MDNTLDHAIRVLKLAIQRMKAANGNRNLPMHDHDGNYPFYVSAAVELAELFAANPYASRALMNALEDYAVLTAELETAHEQIAELDAALEDANRELIELERYRKVKHLDDQSPIYIQ